MLRPSLGETGQRLCHQLPCVLRDHGSYGTKVRRCDGLGARALPADRLCGQSPWEVRLVTPRPRKYQYGPVRVTWCAVDGWCLGGSALLCASSLGIVGPALEGIQGVF